VRATYAVCATSGTGRSTFDAYVASRWQASRDAASHTVVGRRTLAAVNEIRVIRPEPTAKARQRLGYFLGVSGETCGSTGLAMHLVVVPPGTSAEPHLHEGYETAIYQLEGLVETRYGPRLEQSVVTRAGDFIYVPPGIPHQAVNLSQTEAAVAIVARNDPNEQERVVPYEA
jgi:uncharacterized RmlC-like cupin family protein